MNIDLSEYMILGGRLPAAGSRLTMDDRWHEDGALYCRIQDPDGGSGTEFALSALVESDGQRFLLLGGTPPELVDSTVHTYCVTRLISADTVELISSQELKAVSARCEEALQVDDALRMQALKQFFGTFREWD